MMLFTYNRYNIKTHMITSQPERITMMKKLFYMLLAIFAIAVIAGCGSNKASLGTPSQSTPTSINTSSKSLVVYFSMPETNNPTNMTRDEDNSVVIKDNKVLGNTEYMAQVIANTTNSDMFRLVPVNPDPTDHQTLVAQAKEEQNQTARPEYKEPVPNVADYDTIFIGYPNWWGDMPMIMYTFLENNNLAGKTIIPFGTHGGSGFSNTINTIQRLQPNASVVQDGLMMSRNDIQNGESTIINWLQRLGYDK